MSSSSSGIGSLCSLTNSVSVNSDMNSSGQQQQPSTVNAKVAALPELSRVYARNVKIFVFFVREELFQGVNGRCYEIIQKKGIGEIS